MLSEITIGIDISKDKIDVCILPEAKKYVFANDIAGFLAFSQVFTHDKVANIIFEATGRYHRGLEEFLHSQSLSFSKVNPAQAKSFARALGHHAKTDSLDALMLAKMGLALAPEPTNYKGETLAELRDLLMAYRALTKDKVACSTRIKGIKSELLQKQAAERMAQIKEHINAITAEMEELVMHDNGLKHRLDLISSIPGVGGITALNIIIEMPELGSMNNKQAAALAGLAPITRQSGQWKGHSFIGRGRHMLRKAIYMPVLAACSFHNQTFKAKYQALLERNRFKWNHLK